MSSLFADTSFFIAFLNPDGARLDKNWSMTDCASFLVMNRRQLTQALTSDHHFEQAGFTILLGGSSTLP